MLPAYSNLGGEMNERDAKQEMIGRIVAAYAARPDVDANAIMELLTRLTREMLDGTLQLAEEDARPVGRVEPALPVDKAMTKDKVYCLCCGKGFKMLKRHLGAEHGLSEAEYRTMFDLPSDMPLVAPSYSRKKAEYAKEAGFGKYSRKGPARAGKKGAKV